LTGFSQRLAARRAIQEAHAEPGLEPRNHLADSRAREVHALGRQRETARVDHLYEGRYAIEPVRHIGSLQE
jgi:hypothetical protein